MNNNDKIIFGLWNKTSKNDLHYCQGKCNVNGITYRVVLFKNTSKRKEKSPDYSVILQKV